MSAQLSATGLIQGIHRTLGVIVFSFFLLPFVAHAELVALSKSAEITLQGLRADPYALNPDSGKVNVSFSVRLRSKNKVTVPVYLRRSGDQKAIAMNDQGKNGIYGANVAVDTTKLKPDSCFKYEAYVRSGRAGVTSSSFNLCVSAFPLRLASSDVAKAVVFEGGAKAVADEILVTMRQGAKSVTINRLAAEINARVVGSIPQLNLYQFKLAEPATSSRLAALVKQLGEHSEVTAASTNAIGTFASSDTYYASQHGLLQTGAQNVWATGATGSGVTVIVLDSGLEHSHPDLDPAWTCQLPGSSALVACTDTVGHGTLVAGVIAARTDNGIGVAGIAYGSTIHSIKVNSTPNPNDPTHPFVLLGDMQTAFTDAANYVSSLGVSAPPAVINASFSVQVGNFTNVTSLCQSINSAVTSGNGAVVANAAGNDNSNGYIYPGRCNINEPAGQPHAGQNELLGAKNRLISVANSISQPTTDCLVNGTGLQNTIDTRCEGHMVGGVRAFASNYGSWVDIAAPGSNIYSTAIGGGYATATGTSFSAPMVAGAAAILSACGVSVDQIEQILKTSGSTMMAAFPDGTSPPRLDINHAMHINTPSATNMSAPEAFVEDTALDLVNIVITDPNPCAFVTATLTLSNIAAGSLSTATSGSVTSTFSGGVWSASGPVANVNALLAGVTFNPSPNYNGTFSIATTVSDGYAPVISGSKVMTGIAVNDAPSFVKGADQTVLEDAGPQTVMGWATAISTGPADESGQTLTFNITGNTNAALFSAGPTISPAGTLAYTPAPNANGSATITVRLQDNGGTANLGVDTSAPQTFNINVTSVNDAPSFMKGPDQTVPENAGPQSVTGWATAISAGPADEAGQILNFNIVGNTNAAMFSAGPSISPTGTLTYTPAANVSGSATITIQLLDNGGTANLGIDTSASQSFMINVTHAAVPPSGVVGIDGVRKYTTPVPSFLHANTSGVSNPDGWSINHYQWQESIAPPPGDTPVDISTATNPTATSMDYQLQVTDIEKYMRVCAIYSDPANTQLCSGTDTTAIGDPHISTVDGLHYDFQSAGEFVGLRNSSGMELQVRQSPVSTAAPLTDAYSGLTSGVSVNSAIAARVGKHRVTYQADPNNNTASGAPVLRVDGAVTSLQAGDIDFGDGGRVTAQGSGIQIDFPDQTTLIVSTGQWVNNVWWMHLSVYHTSAYEGIMGARLKGGWLPRLADGSTLGAMPVSLHDRYAQLYGKFADSWRVTEKTSLFDYAEGTSTATFTNKEWPTENGPYVAGPGPVAKPLGRKIALQACRDVVGKNENADCVFDVMVMGNKGIANAHLLNQKVRFGATQVIVRGAGKPDAQGEMAFVATVARQATVLPQMRAIRAVPAGMVQFMINGEKAGAPVKLDEKGQARWKVSYQRFYKQRVTAQYIPAKGSTFLPSSRIVRTGLVLEKK